MTRIAVTGATGFVGRSLVARLQHESVDVLALTRSRPAGVSPINTSFVSCDYFDTPSLADLLSTCDVVVHLAALAHNVSRSSSAYVMNDYRRANCASLVSVARAASQAGVSRLVFVSSIGVNGSATDGTPFTEADQPLPSEPYAVTKLEAERALEEELRDSLTDWVVLRPPLIYGPGCPGNLERLIRLTSSAPLLPFGSVNSLRTLISIDNLIDAILIAAHHTAVSRRVFVVADSEDIDVAGILKAMLLGLGRGTWRLLPVPPPFLGFLFVLLGKKSLWKKFSGELRVDSSSFSRATGWLPVVRPQDGLRLTAAFTRLV
ncbi:MAG: NAD-dependent epimerase/dehydratase family protein [Synechococcus sp.]